jgi:hypothetical protein
VCVLELEEPTGWVTVLLEQSMDQTCFNPHPRGSFLWWCCCCWYCGYALLLLLLLLLVLLLLLLRSRWC